MWDTIERVWSETVARARRLPEPARHEQVDDEWSFVETLRHLVFATDAWASRAVLDDPMPYDRLGYPQSDYPPADAVAIGIDLDARPSFDEVMAVRADRMAVVLGIVDRLTDGGLDRVRTIPGALVSRGAAHGRAVLAGRDEGGVRPPPVCGARPRRAGSADLRARRQCPSRRLGNRLTP